MTKERTLIEAAAGKLISAIQKEWGKELGDPEADQSEEVMNKGHDLLQGAKNINEVLKGSSVTQFLGEEWVRNHPSVRDSIKNLEMVITNVE